MTSRQFHRWAGLAAALLFLFVSTTGVVLQCQKIFGDEDVNKEEMEQTASSQKLAALLATTLDSARVAVVARYRDATVASVNWQFKGEPPLIVFHLEGPTHLRVSVDATTSHIVKTESDEESWVRRLHSGELLGEAGKYLGLLGGIALIGMTITGLLMYARMMQGRNKTGQHKGLTHWFWVAVLAALIPQAAYAGSPFLTDDPGFAANGWEIKGATTYEKTINGETITAPILDLNYTVVPTFKLNLTLAGRRNSPTGATSEYGMADTDFKFKWRFVEEDANSWQPAVSMAPNITFPTADKNRGLGDEVWRLRLPVQIGKTLGNWYSYAETGYQFAFDPKATDVIPFGAATQYQLTDKVSLGAELNGNVPVDDSAQWTMLANLGGSYALTESVQMQASLGRTLRDIARGGSEVLVQTFVQWNF